jgi:hypothetical protein
MANLIHDINDLLGLLLAGPMISLVGGNHQLKARDREIKLVELGVGR